MDINTKILSKVILKNIFNDKHSEIDLIKNILIESLPNKSIEFILYILSEPGFKTLNQYDYFKVLYSAVLGRSSTLIDNLLDDGLYKDGYIYGRILDSDDYGSTFSPYNPKMKVELYLHGNENKLMETYNETIETWLLEKIDKTEIKYFNHNTKKIENMK